jgi:Restriction endonuclease EcoRII, N-terminal
MINSAIKRLSENDVGTTNSHQAGFLIPKSLVRGGLFEKLSEAELNPRLRLKFRDLATREDFFPSYIYYNNKFFSGTRHEYRLTGLTKWIRESGLRPGDSIQVTKTDKFDYDITIIKKERRPKTLSEESWVALYGKGQSDD